jgi:hypothetical protein
MPLPTPVSPENIKSEFKDENSPVVKEMEHSAPSKNPPKGETILATLDYLRILKTDSDYMVPQGKTVTVLTYRRRIHDTIDIVMNTKTKPPACASNDSDRL